MENKKIAVLGVAGVGLLATGLYLLTRGKAPPTENIVLSDLIIEPSEVYIGESVSITAVATNIGETKGSYEVNCEVV